MGKIHPPKLLLITVILSIILHFTMPIKYLAYRVLSYGGALLIIFGVYTNYAAAQQYSKKTSHKARAPPVKLLTKGPYAFTRNPMYLGMASITAGIAILLGSLGALIPVITYVIILDQEYISQEEVELEKAFGKQYSKYKKKVRRWI